MDIPGYGFAKGPKEDKERWTELIESYIENDQLLSRAVVIVDARNGPSKTDIEAIEFLDSCNISALIVASKWDALKRQALRAKRKKEIQGSLERFTSEQPILFLSAVSGDGIKELARLLKTQ